MRHLIIWLCLAGCDASPRATCAYDLTAGQGMTACAIYKADGSALRASMNLPDGRTLLVAAFTGENDARYALSALHETALDWEGVVLLSWPTPTQWQLDISAGKADDRLDGNFTGSTTKSESEDDYATVTITVAL